MLLGKTQIGLWIFISYLPEAPPQGAGPSILHTPAAWPASLDAAQPSCCPRYGDWCPFSWDRGDFPMPALYSSRWSPECPWLPGRGSEQSRQCPGGAQWRAATKCSRPAGESVMAAGSRGDPQAAAGAPAVWSQGLGGLLHRLEGKRKNKRRCSSLARACPQCPWPGSQPILRKDRRCP